MTRFLALAAALLFSGAALAQTSVPKAKCEPKPVYPGAEAMQNAAKRDAFTKELKGYQECIRAFVAERRAVVQANNDAIKDAVEEHNLLINKVQADQDAAQAGPAAAPKK